MIVISDSDSDSDSDSEFMRDVQEVTRWPLMTVELSPVREAVSDSDDDEEKVAVKRLLLVISPFLAFRGEPTNKTKLVITWKQYCSLDSGRKYASFVSRQLPVACNTSGIVPQATGSWARSFTFLAEAWHYQNSHVSALSYTGS